MLDSEVVKSALDRFQMCVGLAIKVDPYLIEIPQAAINGQVSAPILWIALERQALAGVNAGNCIRTAAKRRLKRGFVESLLRNRMFGQHRHETENEGKLAIIAAGKLESHAIFVDDFCFYHLDIVTSVIRTSFVTQQLPRKNDILRRNRLAVGKLRFWIETKSYIAALRVSFHILRNKSVQREWLIEATRHQAFHDVAADCLRSDPLHDERIEAVKCPKNPLNQPSAFWR